MKKGKKFYVKLFLTSFYLSAFTFGGGYVIVPLMRDKFVNKLKWIEEQEMIEMIGIAQSSPGAMAINSSIIVGYKLGGILGVVTTVIATILPPFVIISIIFYFYLRFQNNHMVVGAMRGMRLGVLAIMINVILKMIREINGKNDKKLVIIMGMAFILGFYINIVWIIIFFAIIGIFFNKTKRSDKR